MDPVYHLPIALPVRNSGESEESYCLALFFGVSFGLGEIPPLPLAGCILVPCLPQTTFFHGSVVQC